MSFLVIKSFYLQKIRSKFKSITAYFMVIKAQYSRVKTDIKKIIVHY